MQISPVLFYGTIEALVVVLIVCVLLVIALLKKADNAKQLKSNLHRLAEEYKKLKASSPIQESSDEAEVEYADLVNQQIKITKSYHEGLASGRDITLDLDPQSPEANRTAAIRHAILIAEKEAMNAGRDGKPNWEFLQNKLNNLIKFYTDLALSDVAESPPNNLDTTENAEKVATLENSLEEAKNRLTKAQESKASLEEKVMDLERFKQLFYDMEKKWRIAKDAANDYYDRFMELRKQLTDTKGFDEVLNGYHSAYNDFDLVFEDLTRESPSGFSTDAPISTQSILSHSVDLTASESAKKLVETDKKVQDELLKLRHLTSDQHKLISKLQQRLTEAESPEEKERVVIELEKELQKQVRYAKESEVCIQLLEDELEAATVQSQALSKELEDAKEQLSVIPRMQETLREFTVETKELMENLEALEEANEKLRSESQQEDEESAAQLEKVHGQLVTLRKQYAELEERYIQAKSTH